MADSRDSRAPAQRSRTFTTLLLSVMGLSFLCGMVSGLLWLRFDRNPKPAGDPRIFLDKFAEDFDLSPLQIRQLRLIIEERDSQKRTLMESYIESLPPEKRRSFREVNRDADRRIHAILDARQKHLYREMLHEEG